MCIFEHLPIWSVIFQNLFTSNNHKLVSNLVGRSMFETENFTTTGISFKIFAANVIMRTLAETAQ